MKTFAIVLMFVLNGTMLWGKNYKGAEIYSTESYKYGRFEMSIKSAPGSGQLSAFFLYLNESETSSKLWQEIDIEIFGKDTNKFQSNVIIEKTEGKQLATEAVHTAPRSLSASFHTYTLEWTPDSINWYLDGVLMRTEKEHAASCSSAMSIRFNHWAHTSTSWVGAFDTKALPQYQYVDYISYSAYTPLAGDNGSDYTFAWRDDFTSFNSSRWAKANWTFGGNYCDFLPANAYTENEHLVLKLHDATPPPVVSISSVNAETDLLAVSPNPFSSSISLRYDNAQDYRISLFGIDGKAIIDSRPLNAATEASIIDILLAQTNGVYALVLMQDGSLAEKHVLVKE